MRVRLWQQPQQCPCVSRIMHHREKAHVALRGRTLDFSGLQESGAACLREQPLGIEQATKWAALVPEPPAAASTDHARIPERAGPHLPGPQRRSFQLEMAM